MSNGQVSATISNAFQRSTILGVLTGVVTALTSRQQDQSWEQCLIAGAIVLLTTVIARGGLEGAYDGQRQAEGSVAKSDVQPN